jgi:predicted HTH domain antitoxin
MLCPLIMITKSIRRPESLLDAITHVEKEEKIEETTAIRKFIKIGYETYLMDQYKVGKLTLADISRYLDINQIEALELLLKRGVKGNLDASVLCTLWKSYLNHRDFGTSPSLLQLAPAKAE